ncbi:DNA-binding GntR family transcriptional regulator [Streptomyces sp. SAI-170]|uniref:GntR family transcriptional regulator n=1 Tax=Streptomyces sp. SAI-170 TaxID=3377729 RepID=UPI003C7A0DA4
MTKPVHMAAELLYAEVCHLPLQQRGQANRVYRGLREAIISGAIPPGVRLVYGDLASGYKVGRPIVSAALNGLAREGLVRRELMRVAGMVLVQGPTHDGS